MSKGKRIRRKLARVRLKRHDRTTATRVGKKFVRRGGRSH